MGDKYGLARKELELRGKDDVEFACYLIDYWGGPVEVRVGCIIADGPRVVLVDKAARSPSQREPVNLDSLIEFITSGEVQPVVPPERPGASTAAFDRRVKAIRKLFEESLEETVRELAQRLQKYGHKWLIGETDDFLKYFSAKDLA